MNEYRRKGASQFGQEGVLEEVFKRLGVGPNPWCVEIGAYDGHTLSNTWNLINVHGWHSVQIEAEPDRFAALSECYAGRPDVHCLNARVESLAGLLAATPLPPVFDLACIDVDGDDYQLWQSLAPYRPRVVLVECNPTFGWDVEYVPKRGGCLGASALSLLHLGESLGYRLAAVVEIDLLFVDAGEFDKLRIAPRSLAEHMTLSDRHIPRLVSDQKGRHYLLRSGPWGARDDDDILYNEFLRSRRELAETAEVLAGAPRLWEGDDAWPCRKHS